MNSLIEMVTIDLLQILPDSLKTDKNTVFIIQAISETMQNLSEEIFILDPDKKLDGTALDLVAWEEHVDFYDPSLPIDRKQYLVDNAMKFHKKKGTPAAVEDLISTVFEDGEVVEWFEYGGTPYTFKVLTNNVAVTNEKAADFIRALDSIKNLRSRLEKVEITQTEEMDFFFGGFLHMGDAVVIK
jgi:phage tail P2-like protein